MNKRLLARLAVAGLMIAAFSGCGGAEPTPGGSDANVSSQPTGVDNILVKEAAKKQCSDYNELKKAVAILIEKVEASENEMALAAANGKNGVDGVDGLSGKDGVATAPVGMSEQERKDLELLRAEVAQLKRQLDDLPEISKDNADDFNLDKQIVDKYCRNINVVSIDPKRAYVAKADVWVRPCPTKTSKPLRLIKKGTVVKYRGCDIYGWCELSDGSGFVAGFSFKRKK